MAKPNQYKYIYDMFGSSRIYKSTKRKNVRNLMKELEDLRWGSVAMTEVQQVKLHEILRLAKGLKEDLSIKKWGR